LPYSTSSGTQSYGWAELIARAIWRPLAGFVECKGVRPCRGEVIVSIASALDKIDSLIRLDCVGLNGSRNRSMFHVDKVRAGARSKSGLGTGGDSSWSGWFDDSSKPLPKGIEESHLKAYRFCSVCLLDPRTQLPWMATSLPNEGESAEAHLVKLRDIQYSY